MSFSDRLLELSGVFVAPGSGYGGGGEGYARFSLTVPDDRLAEAMDRLGRALA
jgi:LL-diaminopimelate aminotransferase